MGGPIFLSVSNNLDAVNTVIRAITSDIGSFLVRLIPACASVALAFAAIKYLLAGRREAEESIERAKRIIVGVIGIYLSGLIITNVVKSLGFSVLSPEAGLTKSDFGYEAVYDIYVFMRKISLPIGMVSLACSFACWLLGIGDRREDVKVTKWTRNICFAVVIIWMLYPVLHYAIGQLSQYAWTPPAPTTS